MGARLLYNYTAVWWSGVTVSVVSVSSGIILVHDLTNRKSHGNLTKWLSEFHHSQSRDQSTVGSTRTTRSLHSFDSRGYVQNIIYTQCLYSILPVQ